MGVPALLFVLGWVCWVIVVGVNLRLWFFGLVVFVWVDGVFGEDFTGFAVDGEGVGSGDEDEDVFAVVGSSDAEVS